MAKESATTRSKAHSAARHEWIRRVVSGRPRFLPPEFHEHSRAARKEVLLAVRSLIDARIEQLEGTKKDPTPPKKTHQVKVE